MPQQQSGPVRVVIIGGGFAGAYCARGLCAAMERGEVQVTLIDRNNYMIFYPLLIEAGTGSIEPRHAVIPLRALISGVDFRMAEVVNVDTADRTVSITMPEAGAEQILAYDHLVIALGSVTKLPDVPGLREHGFQIKSISDAVALRDRAIQMLELASAIDDRSVREAMLRFVIVGGNYTGVELTGELQALLQRAAGGYPDLDPRECRVSLVEMLGRILNVLDDDLARYAAQKLESRGIDMHLRTTVDFIAHDMVRLSDGHELPTRTVVWCAGVAPNPLIARIGLPTDRLGYITCEPDLRVKGYDDVWALGDCAANPGPDGKPYAPTAQHAVPMGKAAARNILRSLRGQQPQPFIYHTKGVLAPLGHRTAVAKVGPLRLSGFPAWVLWRSFYLARVPGAGRKVRLLLDWLVDLVLGHDHVQLGVHRARKREKAFSEV